MRALCEAIGMPREAAQEALRWQALPVDLTALTREERWQTGLNELEAQLEPDPLGFKMLSCMLRCALGARAEYDRLGLSEEVYRATMACFSRFVREHQVSYGVYGFDRGFWTVRQVSCRLFRIGQLEYELIGYAGNPAISLHIPTDVRLQLPLLRASWEQARQLLGQTFPEYKDAPMLCHSWLLSPSLQELLPEDSNILRFQRAFEIQTLPGENTDYGEWVFKNPKLTVEQYPEDTSLQRNLKRFLLLGGKFLDAGGTLKEDPFTER